MVVAAPASFVGSLFGGDEAGGRLCRRQPSAVVPPVGPMALSRAHIYTGEKAAPDVVSECVDVFQGGRLVRFRSPWSLMGGGGGGSVTGRKRGKVRGFTHASRSRLLQQVARIDQRAIVNRFFGTLTCPPVALPVFKRLMRAFRVRLERTCPGRWFVVWRLELHKSGAPHLHFMLYWRERSPNIRGMRAILDAAWMPLVAAAGLGEEGRCGWVQCSYVNAAGRAEGYTCKPEHYMSKGADDCEVEDAGRWWGVWRGRELPVSLLRVKLGRAEWVKVQRVCRRWCKVQGRVWRAWDKDNKPIGESGALTVTRSLVKSMRRAGFKVKRSSPSYLRRDEVDVWGREEGGGMILLGREIVSECRRRLPIPPRVVLGLLSWVLGCDVLAEAGGAL